MDQDIKTILLNLTDRDSSDSIAAEKTIELINGSLHSHELIDHLKSELDRIKDFRGDREPFYHLYLSVAYLKQKNYKSAKDILVNAVQGFQIQGFSLNEALGEWLFGIIHFENGNNERAQRACESASTIFQQLITQYEAESKYEKAKEHRDYLIQLDIFWKIVKESQDSIRQKTTQEDTDNYSNPSKIYASKHETEVFKVRLKKFKDELEETYKYLREQKMQVPPTLVAAKFYIYKILTPAHSVYSRVPPPETDREREIYTDLIKKIGFFEVVEQLVELERVSEPLANREEILDKINAAWDKEINH